jgi:hypothetical protein
VAAFLASWMKETLKAVRLAASDDTLAPYAQSLQASFALNSARRLIGIIAEIGFESH